MKRNLVLFDIDGTLLHAHGAGREAFAEAFEKVFGWEQGVEHINFYGATDLSVFRRIAAERGVESTSEMEAAFFSALPAALETRLSACPPEIYPGVPELLEALNPEPVTPKFTDEGGWTLGIVTGNIEATARSKLKYAGLLTYFTVFGCGCEHADRIEIARKALERAGDFDCGFLIGDTPSDINAARAHGLTSVAVATGGFAAEELENAGADFLFSDLTDTNRLLSILNER